MSVDNSIVSVDDTDPQIAWSGPWFTTENNVDDLGNLGPPFLRTLHGISSDGSLSFSFYGRMVSVWGSLRPRNTAAGPDPNWQCIVDGQDIGKPLEYPSRPLSNYLLCWSRSLAEGNHTLQLNAVIQSEILYVDQVQYQAAANADIGNSWTEVRQRDGRIKYSVGWEEDDSGYRKWTYAPGAWLTYDFTGTDIIWGGYTPDSLGDSAGSGQYMIDGKEPPTSFVIPSRSGSFTSQPYFNVTGLKPGPHRLQVTNTGNPSTAALGLTYIYTKNSSADTPITTRNSGKVIGGAVGGSIGALLLIILGIVILIKRRKRSSNTQQEQEAEFSAKGTTRLEGRPVSMLSGSTIVKDRLSPEPPTQGTWGQVSHQPPNVTSTTFRNSTTSSALYGSSQHNHSAFVNPPASPTLPVTPQPGPPVIPSPNRFHPPAPASVSTMSPPPAYVQQMVWPRPRPIPVQHSQDGRPEEAEDNPYR